MAFMGRGSAPTRRGNKTGGSSRGHHRGHWYHRRFYYYVSPSYILIEMIVFCIIFIIGLITFFATHSAKSFASLSASLLPYSAIFFWIFLSG